MTPTSVFRKAILASVISSTLALTGCGGSDDDSSSENAPQTPASNKAPTVSIGGEDQAKEQTEFKLSAEAADSDGSIASYEWTYQSDIDLTVSGADSAELTVTSANISEDKAVTFTLTVTDDDGATASVDKAIVIKRKVSSVTITGIVTDKPIVNANLTIFAGSASVNAFADETGRYTATFSVDESEADSLVQIRATGLGDQNNVEFVSQLNSMNKLVEQAGEDGELISDENFGVNITNVSTAEYALLTREGEAFSTDEELQQALLNVDAEEKLKLAALIKIVVDNDDYELPEGVESTLDLVDDEATATEFEQAVNERDPGLIEKTEDEIRNDKDLVTTKTTLGTGDFIIHSPEFVTRPAYHLSLGENGKGGTISSVNQVEIDTWTVNDGRLKATLLEPLIISQSTEQLFDENGQPVYDSNNELIFQDVKYKTSEIDLLVLSENDVYRTVDFTSNAQRFADGVYDESYEPSEKAYTSNLLDKNMTLAVQDDELLGTWFLNVFDLNHQNNEPESVEKLTLLADGQVVGGKEGETITWQLENNLLTFTYTHQEGENEVTGSMSMWMTKSLEVGYQFVAIDNGTKNDAKDAHSKSEWGWLFKQDEKLKLTREQVIGRWTGFMGYEQLNSDMIVEDDLNVKIGFLESSNDGHFVDDIFYRGKEYKLDGQDVAFCDTSESNCTARVNVKHEFVAIEGDKYYVRRTWEDDYDYDGVLRVNSDRLFIYKYSSNIAHSEFTESLLNALSNKNYWGQPLYLTDSNGKAIEISVVYKEEYNNGISSLVSNISMGDQSNVFRLVNGKLEYGSPEESFVVELIEQTEAGLKVCTYPKGEECTTENTVLWTFDMPHLGEFVVNNPDLFESQTYQINLSQNWTNRHGSIKEMGNIESHPVTWHLEDGALIIEPENLVLSEQQLEIDGMEVTEITLLDNLKLIFENDQLQVEETRRTTRDGLDVLTQVNQYDSKKLTESDYLTIEADSLLGTWFVDSQISRSDLGSGSYYLEDGNIGHKIDIYGVEHGFNWQVTDRTIEINYEDGMRTERLGITKDLRIDGFQFIAHRSDGYENWVTPGLMVKDDKSLIYSEPELQGRWLLQSGEDQAEELLTIQVHDDFTIRFGTFSSSIQGMYENNRLVRKRFYNPIENKFVEPCDTSLDTCELNYQMVYRPLAQEGDRTYFLREWEDFDQNRKDTHIQVLDKAEEIGISELKGYMLDFMRLVDKSDVENPQWWSTGYMGVFDGQLQYGLQIGTAEPLPYTFANGKMTVRMGNGLVYHIELVPGSNTKDGVTFCQYLVSDTCLPENHIQLNYNN
ncbi:hypothetical protein C1E23_00330 [Pseudoalteromonas phenolica]|uniref:PKD/Chitinase domain-containing protein n=1 Tax=Pseudoalteromonas phenolica TaxID=161398 RepID=A0A4Q7IRU5_9GAMM|nr:PKD domain-containing protein [Pseudoalteromonas phenolica]RZQ55114.1 hypothetical protein C1E23_00330 [Pseudoalteromonas phenolica]